MSNANISGRGRGQEVIWTRDCSNHHRKVKIIKKRMKAAQDRHKSYADIRKRPFEFIVGDRVYLKVAP
jgi:hypothetical protein